MALPSDNSPLKIIFLSEEIDTNVTTSSRNAHLLASVMAEGDKALMYIISLHSWLGLWPNHYLLLFSLPCEIQLVFTSYRTCNLFNKSQLLHFIGLTQRNICYVILKPPPTFIWTIKAAYQILLLHCVRIAFRAIFKKHYTFQSLQDPLNSKIMFTFKEDVMKECNQLLAIVNIF